MPAAPVWGATDPAFRRSEVSAVIGVGEECWQRSVHDVLRWRVKTRSGFRVEGSAPVQAGQFERIRAGVPGLSVVEPVEVVEVVEEAGRAGFSYRTLPGHPVDGEEAFIVHREASGEVVLTVRSLTRPAPQQPWRALHPLLRIAQRVARRRYLRALRS
jgi:uncharacterized protein (UPF0548 family)